jgi:thymidylate synthase (FAD)
MTKATLFGLYSDLQADIAYMARVSNPSAEYGVGDERLLRYLIDYKHWSPFEMRNVVLEIETTRDIARQMLRHRSFSFQEFSQRYSEVELPCDVRETRLHNPTNRQSSLPNNDLTLDFWWQDAQRSVLDSASRIYYAALENGISKEVARCVLPEGLTPSKMYVNGTLRSWIHYIDLRTGSETQKEHRELARACAEAIEPVFPMIKEFVNDE